MADTPFPGPAGLSRVHQVLGAYTSVALTAVLAALAWVGSQFVEVRDTVRTLKETVPIRLQVIETRIDGDEHRLEQLEHTK